MAKPIPRLSASRTRNGVRSEESKLALDLHDAICDRVDSVSTRPPRRVTLVISSEAAIAAPVGTTTTDSFFCAAHLGGVMVGQRRDSQDGMMFTLSTVAATGDLRAGYLAQSENGGCAMADPQRYKVLLFNDDVTPMEFVVRALQDFFDLDFDEACKLMLRVHHAGSAVCGTYAQQEAEQKVADVLSFAGKHRHPLKCAAEKAH
jgi:ATP-dependent Clp protease adaptor protein ClpS